MEEPTNTTPTPSRGVRVTATLLMIGLWGLVGALVLAIGLEWMLQAPRGDANPETTAKPRFQEIHSAYEPFTTKHLHPHYLFSMPFEAEARLAISNDYCHLTPDGFRASGPEEANGRKLAFFLGGSSAFGYYASADSTTITGYLNRMQDTYHFVNAGVPSWNSSQELFRLAHDLMAYQPDLVVAYDGVNDFTISHYYLRKALGHYPLGAPEGFDRLYALLGVVDEGQIRLPKPTWYERFFPKLTRRIRQRLGHRTPAASSVDVPTERLRPAAHQYVQNIRRMRDLVEAEGGRFMGIHQPATRLHQHIAEADTTHPVERAARAFYGYVLHDPQLDVEYLDFSNFFDRYFEAVPFYQRQGPDDLSDDIVFMDAVHLFDRGNRMIADSIRTYLAQPAFPPSTTQEERP